VTAPPTSRGRRPRRPAVGDPAPPTAAAGRGVGTFVVRPDGRAEQGGQIRVRQLLGQPVVEQPRREGDDRRLAAGGGREAHRGRRLGEPPRQPLLEAERRMDPHQLIAQPARRSPDRRVEGGVCRRIGARRSAAARSASR